MVAKITIAANDGLDDYPVPAFDPDYCPAQIAPTALDAAPRLQIVDSKPGVGVRNERALIGVLLLMPDAWKAVASAGLAPEHFSDEQCHACFIAIAALNAEMKPTFPGEVQQWVAAHADRCGHAFDRKWLDGCTDAAAPRIGDADALCAAVKASSTEKAMRIRTDEPRTVIEHVPGNTPKAADDTIAYMRGQDIYDYGEEPAIVAMGSVFTLDGDSLGYWCGRHIQYITCDKKGKPKNEDAPDRLVRQVMAQKQLRGLKPLTAVITAPTITPSGRAVDAAGYNQGSGLYLACSTHASVPGAATVDDAGRALAALMRPFRGFALAEQIDHSTLLAAVLTAIERPALQTAPAIAVDAPTQGTGKTFLAECLAALGGDLAPAEYAHTLDEDETRKRLMTVLLDGRRTLIWDNVLGTLASASLASFVTAKVYSDRILGRTGGARLPNRVLLFITGNNITLAGDMPRRALRIRLDARVENPACRKFNSNPFIYICQNRQELVGAALTIIRAYLCSSEYKAGGAVPHESTASFEEWDQLVRQTVAWVGQRVAPGEYPDPADAMRDATASDPEREALGDLLEALRGRFAREWFEAKDIVRSLAAYSDSSELREALAGIDPRGEKTGFTPKSLGRVLANRADRIARGMKIIRRTTGGHTSWRVEDTSAGAVVEV